MPSLFFRSHFFFWVGFYQGHIWQSHIWQCHIWQSHIWQSHMAMPYGSRGRGCRRGRGLAMQWKTWNFFQELYPGKSDLRKLKNTKKNRLKILYRTPYLKNRDFFLEPISTFFCTATIRLLNGYYTATIRLLYGYYTATIRLLITKRTTSNTTQGFHDCFCKSSCHTEGS